MATMHCEIVSAEKELFSGEIQMLSARGTVGELGIMPGHAPLLTGIQPGTVVLRLEDGSEEIFFASGGFLEIQPGFVTVLADIAARAEDIDEAQAITIGIVEVATSLTLSVPMGILSMGITGMPEEEKLD